MKKNFLVTPTILQSPCESETQQNDDKEEEKLITETNEVSLQSYPQDNLFSTDHMTFDSEKNQLRNKLSEIDNPKKEELENILKLQEKDYEDNDVLKTVEIDSKPSSQLGSGVNSKVQTPSAFNELPFKQGCKASQHGSMKKGQYTPHSHAPHVYPYTDCNGGGEICQKCSEEISMSHYHNGYYSYPHSHLPPPHIQNPNINAILYHPHPPPMYYPPPRYDYSSQDDSLSLNSSTYASYYEQTPSDRDRDRRLPFQIHRQHTDRDRDRERERVRERERENERKRERNPCAIASGNSMDSRNRMRDPYLEAPHQPYPSYMSHIYYNPPISHPHPYYEAAKHSNIPIHSHLPPPPGQAHILEEKTPCSHLGNRNCEDETELGSYHEENPIYSSAHINSYSTNSHVHSHPTSFPQHYCCSTPPPLQKHSLYLTPMNHKSANPPPNYARMTPVPMSHINQIHSMNQFSQDVMHHHVPPQNQFANRYHHSHNQQSRPRCHSFDPYLENSSASSSNHLQFPNYYNTQESDKNRNHIPNVESDNLSLKKNKVAAHSEEEEGVSFCKKQKQEDLSLEREFKEMKSNKWNVNLSRVRNHLTEIKSAQPYQKQNNLEENTELILSHNNLKAINSHETTRTMGIGKNQQAASYTKNFKYI